MLLVGLMTAVIVAEAAGLKAPAGGAQQQLSLLLLGRLAIVRLGSGRSSGEQKRRHFFVWSFGECSELECEKQKGFAVVVREGEGEVFFFALRYLKKRSLSLGFKGCGNDDRLSASLSPDSVFFLEFKLLNIRCCLDKATKAFLPFRLFAFFVVPFLNFVFFPLNVPSIVPLPSDLSVSPWVKFLEFTSRVRVSRQHVHSSTSFFFSV